MIFNTYFLHLFKIKVNVVEQIDAKTVRITYQPMTDKGSVARQKRPKKFKLASIELLKDGTRFGVDIFNSKVMTKLTTKRSGNSHRSCKKISTMKQNVKRKRLRTKKRASLPFGNCASC